MTNPEQRPTKKHKIKENKKFPYKQNRKKPKSLLSSSL